MGEMEYEVHDGVGMMFDRSCFAGSTHAAQRDAARADGCRLAFRLPEAVRMASLTPARVIGVDDRKGSLEAGKDADIAIFNDDFTAWGTLINGRWLEHDRIHTPL